MYASTSTTPVSTRDVPTRSAPSVTVGGPKADRVQAKSLTVTTASAGTSASGMAVKISTRRRSLGVSRRRA